MTIGMRPTEQASRTEYVEIPGDVCCMFAVTGYPPIKLKTHTDGGWVTVQRFYSHCHNHHDFRERLRRAWRAFWGCPDTDVMFESDAELAAVLGALGRAAAYAFSDDKPESGR